VAVQSVPPEGEGEGEGKAPVVATSLIMLATDQRATTSKPQVHRHVSPRPMCVNCSCPTCCPRASIFAGLRH